MSHSLFASGQEVLYKWYHSGQLVEATILGPSRQGDDFARLKYSRNVRDYEPPVASICALYGPGIWC